jgi:hypothetical protein
LEGVAQEVERYVFVLPTPIIILAVDNPGLRGMKFQAALPKPIPDGSQHCLCLTLAPAMDNGIVRVALERDTRVIPPHPLIKRIVQEQVGQQRTDYPLNAKDNLFEFSRKVSFTRRKQNA